MKLLNSFYARLLLLTVGTLGVGGAVLVYASYSNAIHEADELFDAQMAHTAQTLLAIAASDTDLDLNLTAPDTGPAQHRYQFKLMFQLWQVENGKQAGEQANQQTGQQRLVLRTPNAPHEPIALERAAGFSNMSWRGHPWRFFLSEDKPHGLRVIVGQDFAIRDELAHEIAHHGVLPFIIGLPIIALLLALAIRGGLRPLRRLHDDLVTRGPERLDAIRLDQPPEEMRPVLAALNRLFARLAQALENERRFTSDAAHELRTPLAAIMAQLQVAKLTPNEQERRAVLDKCLLGAQRMAHLVEQMLTLARMESGSDELAREPLDLAQLAAGVCIDLGPAALAKRLSLELDAPEPVTLKGQPDLLRVLLRNLIDNAIRYTPAGGRIEVSVRAEAALARLEVCDNGPGIAPDQIDQLGERFKRLSDQSVDGVGLGLSIVRRVAALHGASVDFESAAPERGLRVVLRLPRIA